MTVKTTRTEDGKNLAEWTFTLTDAEVVDYLFDRLEKLGPIGKIVLMLMTSSRAELRDHINEIVNRVAKIDPFAAQIIKTYYEAGVEASNITTVVPVSDIL